MTRGDDTILDQTIIRSFSNMGHHSTGRMFPGFLSLTSPIPLDLSPRGTKHLELAKGDLLRIDGVGFLNCLAILAFAKNGTRAEASLGLNATVSIDPNTFESAELTGWLRGRGGDETQASIATVLDELSEPLVLAATRPTDLWIVYMQSQEGLVTGESRGTVKLWHQTDQDILRLPKPLGEIRDEFTIKAGTAQAYELAKGEFVQIIDAQGQQCSDFQAVRMKGLDASREDIIDSTATRTMVRSAFPQPGLLDKFFDAELRPLLRVVQDTCGRHDTFGLACTARGYEERGFPGHINCSDNISHALAPYGVAKRSGWPAINFFWNTWVDPHHQILTEEAFSRPGDYVAMEALDDMVGVSTACPDDIDPINGWNPTDIHVRIYKPETRLQRAVAYRSKEDGPMQISTHSAFHSRLEPLTNHFAPARDLWVPVSFPAYGTTGEYWACRKAATLQDMSGLRKYDVIGPDAEKLLQLAMTRDIAKLAVWRGTYALLCDESGEVIDDGTLFRLSPSLFRWCCGSEESGLWLNELGQSHNLQVRIHDLGGSMPNLALQGPKSRDILRKVAFFQPHVPELDHLKWFGVSMARLNDRDGAPFMLSRTGYTGELGYEIFCAESDALAVWDALMESGVDHGLIPIGSAALEIIRIEAGLASTNEFAVGSDAYEAGLGFAVDLKKSEFVGKDALSRNAAAQRRHLVGLKFGCDDVPAHGAPVFAAERQVGVVTSATRSPMFECAIAMARVTVEHSETGTQLEVGQMDGRMKRLSAQVTDLPFFDPKRERARA